MNLFRAWTLRRGLITLAIIAASTGLFYLEELWRGKYVWKKCERALVVQGIKVDWANYVPAPVADEENVFGVPEMQRWFTEHSGELFVKLYYPAKKPPDQLTITAETAAQFLKSRESIEPDLAVIRQALRRPVTRMKGGYAKPSQIPVPNIGAVRTFAGELRARAKAHRLLGQPEEALQDLMFLDDSCHVILERQQPPTIAAACANGLSRILYVNEIAEGLHSQTWREPQLIALQDRLKQINTLTLLSQAMVFEREVICQNAETETPAQLVMKNYLVDVEHIGQYRWNSLIAPFTPQGWVYQGSAASVEVESRMIAGMQPEEQTIAVEKLDAALRDFTVLSGHWSPRAFLGHVPQLKIKNVFIFNAFGQTKINEALIVCALERHHLAHKEYPERLEALVPQFLEAVPHDIIDGGPLHYHRAPDGKFILYSIGWNGRDDQGTPGSEKNASEDGDWVW